MRLNLALLALVAVSALYAHQIRGAGVNGSVHSPKDTHDAANAGLRPGVPAPAPLPRASRSSRRAPQMRVKNRTTLEVTAYCHTGNRTASGVWPREGMAASNAHPFGARLGVPGWGVVTITDRIGWGSQLDLFMTSRAACLQFGRRLLHVREIR